MKKDSIHNSKSPVRLRKKKLSSGNYSLYLDIYSGGKRKKEYLKLYLVPEKTRAAKEENKNTMMVAETIKAERLLSVQASKSKFLETERKELKMPFADYMALEIERLSKLRTPNYVRRYKTGERWVRKFDDKATLGDIDEKWVRDYIAFLSDAKGHGGKHLNQNTIHEYLIYIANILNIAVREGIIQSNPTKKVSAADKPKKYGGKRDYLTVEELKRMADVPAPERGNEIRRAFLFACFSGLRYSDIQQLKWSDIKENADGIVIEKRMQKTKEMLYLPLSKRAVSYIGDRDGRDGHVFTLPKSMVTVEAYIKVWSEFARIEKHVTFHTSRHTFAVSILTYGGDIYTLSKLLGHKRVTTTQIYADVINETKKKTMELLDKFECQ